jgi:hypothetical protein
MAISFIRIAGLSSPTLSCFGGTSASEFETQEIGDLLSRHIYDVP